jgi:Protein of unknown function (DUF4254)
MLNVDEILVQHKTQIETWQTKPIDIEGSGLKILILKNHSFNFQLWYEEDKARRDDMGFEYVYRAKRNIDKFNQLRNDMIEKIDQWLVNDLCPKHHLDCPVNSETPGMMIDRLSILALKHYHMTLQTERVDVEKSHNQSCLQKLQIIGEQLLQLSQCLAQFLAQIQQGARTFRLYHQFKMYNDPKLNPQLYENA